MKTKLILSLCLFGLFCSDAKSQEKYGKTINLGIGVGGYSGYYRYVGHNTTVVDFNYEFDVAKNFTLAPFVSYYTYSNQYYYGSNANGYKYYSYRETVVPLGIKGTYYFDEILKASSPWDFYLGASLGFALVNSHWDADYTGDKHVYQSADPMYLNFHLGAEYHFNPKIGAFLDLSNGVSTFGLAFHHLK
ncbi:MAG: hypothetical protein CFE21_14020 [Bacteroidetes bacterium B1(2017)]|nr:MAG: hypothetical protein CFE21_14020 [Bacteroidetes bacterium B1(2017)]